jgi:hypothetical protein
MSNYTKATNFASKDELPVGDVNKKLKGVEIDNEFNAIANAVSTKADLQSPTFTGVPAVPTAAFGTSTTQVASTAFVRAAIEALYPVGTIYTSTSATNPASTFGFGTWEAFGEGRVLVGQNTSDASFNTLEETGGTKNATLVSHSHTGTTGGQSVGHTHTFSGTTGGAGAHTHTLQYSSGAGSLVNSIGGGANGAISNSGTAGMTNPGDHAHSFSGTTSDISSNHNHAFTTSTQGSSATNANLQPYIVVKMWKRTA